MYLRSSLSSIVTHEDNKGIIVFSSLLQVFNHPADIIVHRVHHSSIRLHRSTGQLLSLGREIRPFARIHRGGLNIMRNNRFVHDAHLDKFCETALSQGVRALVINALILVALFLGALQGPVRCGIGQKCKEWLGLVILRSPIKVPNQLVSVIVGRVKAFGVLRLIGLTASHPVSNCEY